MSARDGLSRPEAERRFEGFARAARRRRRRRATQAVGVGLSTVLIVGALAWAGLGLSGLRESEPAGPGLRATTVSAGGSHTCAVNPSGGAECWGGNNFGQLGNGTTENSSTPVDVLSLASGVEAVSAGARHTCALTTSGGVTCWGANGFGQLGNGTTKNSATPVDVVGLSSGVVSISAGGDDTCALTAAGGAKCWGANGFGQLGNGTTRSSSTPVNVVGLRSGVSATSAGGNHTCALTTAGAAKCWGLNDDGELGNGTRQSSSMPVDVTGLSIGVAAISAGVTGSTLGAGALSNGVGNFTCALTSSGGVTCWGFNLVGQLGSGGFRFSSTPVDVASLPSGVVAISTGSSFSCALSVSGAVKCWGLNMDGQLGDGSTKSSSTPVDVAGLSSGEIAISAGAYFSCALDSDGAVRCWGDNAKGQLGDGTTKDSLTPVDVQA